MRLAFALALFPGTALAQTLHLDVAGKALAIDTPCAAVVSVTIDHSLSGHVVLDATASHAEEIAPLEFRSVENRAELRRREGAPCYDGESTLHLAFKIPPAFPLSVDDSGDAQYSIADTNAPLAISASGSLKLKAGTVSTLSIDASDSHTIEVAAATGAVHVEASGSGDVAVDRGDISALSLELSGDGKFRFGEGSIGVLSLENSGSADVMIAASVASARVSLSGSGSAHLRRVTGPVSEETEGSARLIIDQRS